MEVDPYLCPYCIERFPTDEAREEHYKTCEQKVRKDREFAKEKERVAKHVESRKSLLKIQMRLEELYLGKRCRVIGQFDKSFKKVTKIETWGHPSAWSWHGELVYEDGTRSNAFKGIRKVEVLKE